MRRGGRRMVNFVVGLILGEEACCLQATYAD